MFLLGSVVFTLLIIPEEDKPALSKESFMRLFILAMYLSLGSEVVATLGL